jgi:hypothetical protein
MTLEEKQAEAFARNLAKRSRQNSKNASGPRKKEERGPRMRLRILSLEQVLLNKLLYIEDPRQIGYIAYVIDCTRRKVPIPSFQEFYYRLGVQDESESQTTEPFKIRDYSTPSSSGQESILREAISVDGY